MATREAIILVLEANEYELAESNSDYFYNLRAKYEQELYREFERFVDEVTRYDVSNIQILKPKLRIILINLLMNERNL